MTGTTSILTTAGSTSLVLPMIVLFGIVLFGIILILKKSDLFPNID